MKDASLTLVNENFRAALASAPVPLLLLNGAARIVLASKSLEQLLGRDAAGLIGLPVEQVLQSDYQGADTDTRERFLRVFFRVMSDPDNQVSAVGRDGRTLPVDVQVSPVDGADSSMLICSISDRTEPNKKLHQLEKQVRALEVTSHDLSRFAYGASHDLKAPLASIIGLLSFCKEDLDDGNLDELQEHLTLAQQLCYTSANRIDAIFDVATAGQHSFPVEDVKLEQVIRDVWHELTRNDGGRSDLQLSFDHGDFVRAERTTLRLLFETLFSNALQFRSAERSDLVVRVSVSIEHAYLRIVVSDNGSGIPDDRQRDVFRMFRDIDERSGNGKGLALLQRHVVRLYGKIGFTSVEGEGSEFSVKLPLDTEDPR